MISNQQLVAKLREQGFQFDESTKRVHTYKKKGGTERVVFHIRDCHDDRVACGYLMKTGMTHSDAMGWITTTSHENAVKAAKN